QLLRAQRQRLARIDVRWPQEHALFEPLGEQAQTGPVPEHDLDQAGLATAKHEEMAREGIQPQHALDQHGEPVDALAHIGVTECQVDLQPSREQDHDACSSSLGAASEGALASAICTVTNIGAALGLSSCFQRNSTRAAIPYRRATSERLAPGCPACSTMRRLSASLKVRRWPSRAGGGVSGWPGEPLVI